MQDITNTTTETEELELEIDEVETEVDENFKIPGAKGLYINSELIITDDIGYAVKELNSFYVNISLFGKHVYVTKEWLYWFSRYELSLPMNRLHHIDKFVFTPVKKTNRKHEPMFVTFPSPVTITHNGTLCRMVPRYPNIAISVDGTKVINIQMMCTMTIYKATATSKYPYIWVRYLKKQKMQSIHRLVAMAWHENDDPYNKVFVDHLNGNKNDCRASNLEWVTIKDNNKRAVDTGLRNDNIPLRIRSCDTGIIESFASSTDVINRIGRSRVNLQTMALEERAFWRGENGLFEVKKGDDKSGWLSEDMDLKLENTSTLRRVVLDGKMYFIEVRKDLADLIPNVLDSQKYSNDNYSYADVLKVLTTYYPNVISDKDIKSVSSKDKRTYIAKNIHTNEILKHASSVTLSKLTNNPKSSVNKSIQHDGAYDFNGWVFKVDNGSDFSPIIDRANTSIKIELINAESGSKTLCNSYREAGSIVGCDKKIIRNRADTNIVYNGYYITTVK